MELRDKIDLRVDPNQRHEFFIEYRIGEGEWIKMANPYYTWGGANAGMMSLREETKHGLNRNTMALLGIEQKNESGNAKGE